MWQKRGPALLCLLLATALTVFAAARSPAAPPGEVPPPQTLEEESLLYEETPVQIISLLDLEPVDTRASANPVRVGGGTLDPVDQAEMASVLAECTLKDNTIVRLYVTAEGLIDGAFLRPGAGWIRFARLYRGADQGPNYAETAALTACSGILGHDGFLLRTDGHCSGVYSYDYYWFDTAGDLQVLTARMDPVALDLDGDGTAELVWEIAEWQGAFSFYFRRTDGAICCVTPSEYIDASGLFLAAVEQEGPGPVRLIYRYHGTDEDQEQFCAVTFRDGALEIEMDLVYVPASLEDTVPLSDPTAGGAALPHVSITGPDGWTMDGAGEAAYLDSLVPSLEQPISLLEGGGDRPHRCAAGCGDHLYRHLLRSADRELLFLVPGRRGHLPPGRHRGQLPDGVHRCRLPARILSRCAGALLPGQPHRPEL